MKPASALCVLSPHVQKLFKRKFVKMERAMPERYATASLVDVETECSSALVTRKTVPRFTGTPDAPTIKNFMNLRWSFENLERTQMITDDKMLKAYPRP